MKNPLFKRIILTLLSIMLICYGISWFLLGQYGVHMSSLFNRNTYAHSSIFNGDFWEDFGRHIENSIEDNYNHWDSSGDTKDSFKDEKSSSIKGISSISIASVSSDIDIELIDGDELKTEFYITGDKDCATLNVESSSDTINLFIKYKNNTSNLIKDSKLKVYIPKSYSNNLKISTVSGNAYIKVSSLNLGEFSLQTTSGDGKIQGLTANSASISSISGNIDFLEQFNGNSLKVTTTSGDVKVSNINGASTISTVSGEIDFSATSPVKGSLSAKSTSGDVDLSVGLLEFSLTGKTTSGDLKSSNKFNSSISKRAISINNGDQYKIDVSTTSGDINVQ